MKNNLLPSTLSRCGQFLKATGLTMCLIAGGLTGVFANNGNSLDAISVAQQSISVRG